MAGAVVRVALLMGPAGVPGEPALEVRHVRSSEWDAYARAVYHGFHEEPLDAHLALWRDLAELDRTMAVFDGGDVVGTAESMAWTLSVPWAPAVACAAVTSVTVAPTHRRRGLLRAMMHRQLREVRDAGEPLAALYASEAPIYGRFGYGVAVGARRTEVRREHAALRPDLTAGLQVRFVELEQAATRCAPILSQALAGRPGATRRPPQLWRAATVLDPEQWREGYGPRRSVVVDGDRGYALYRTSVSAPEPTVRVEELVGVDPPAEASLWAYVLGIDLMRRVEAARRPVDDPLRFMLADPGRQVRTDAADLYLRLVDVGVALSSRGYGVDDTLTLEVTDRTCPWNDRRWRISARGGRAAVDPTTDAPDLALDVAELASLYLGGASASQLHAATLIRAMTPDAVARADALFAGPRPPWNPTAF